MAGTVLQTVASAARRFIALYLLVRLASDVRRTASSGPMMNGDDNAVLRYVQAYGGF